MPPKVLWDDIWKLHGRIALFSFFGLLLVLSAETDELPLHLTDDLPPHLASILPKARAIDNTLYYSLNKFNNKECHAGGRTGNCMFVWECMKTGGQHGGMCMDGFMFGSCCTPKDIPDEVVETSSAAYSSSTSPYSSSSTKFAYSNTVLDIVDSNALVSSLTAKPYYQIPSQRPGALQPVLSQQSSSIYPTSYLTAEHPSKEFQNSSIEETLETTTPESTLKWSHLPSITIKPPEAPKRPTRPPKPTKPDRPALAPWWSYANKQKKPINKTSSDSTTLSSTTSTTTSTTTTTTSTTATTTETPTTVSATTSTFKPPASGPFTTNVHSKHVCGIPRMSPQPEGRIVNGTNSKFGEFPWQTSVRRTSFFGFSSTHRCGGALLNSRWIATAGHCVDDLLTSQIRLRVGEYDFSSVLEPYAYVERKAKKKVVHPNYNFFTYEYDLALVEMESDIEFQPHIQPICLPGNEDLLIGEFAKVTGWGRLSEHGTLPSILQQTSVPLISNDACKQMFLKGGRKEHIPEIFLCAGYEKGGRDSCQGDSGGPLQVKGADGRWFLAGIISWGIGCAEPNLPGVCTRISKFVPFILEHVTGTRDVT